MLHQLLTTVKLLLLVQLQPSCGLRCDAIIETSRCHFKWLERRHALLGTKTGLEQ